MSPHSDQEFSVDEIIELLTELGRRLTAQGVEATLYIVGGVAVAIEFDRRRVTRDIDAVFDPPTTVKHEAQAMAAERGLPKDWLNDNARAWVPGGDADAVPFAVPGLAVGLASPRHLLAMKMAAFRPQDKADIRLLLRHLDIRTAEGAADIAIAVYGENSFALPGRDELILEAQSILGD